jgi:hypothetical protein
VLVRYLHRRLFGDEATLVVLDGVDAETVAAAVGRACRGTLVVRAGDLPRRGPALKQVIEQLADASSVWVVVLGDPESWPLLLDVAIPPIAERRAEQGRILGDAIAEIAVQIGTTPGIVAARDRALFARRGWSSYDELHQAALRLVHLRFFGGAETGRRLGVTTSAISKWAALYGIENRSMIADLDLVVPIRSRRPDPVTATPRSPRTPRSRRSPRRSRRAHRRRPAARRRRSSPRRR